MNSERSGDTTTVLCPRTSAIYLTASRSRQDYSRLECNFHLWHWFVERPQDLDCFRQRLRQSGTGLFAYTVIAHSQ